MFRIVRDIPVSSAHAQTPSCCRLGAEATILKDRSHHGTTSELLDRLKKTGNPLVLTINGKAEVVVQVAEAY